MRHALIPIHLVQDARAAASQPAGRLEDAPPDPQPALEPRRRRPVSLFRRARARTLGLRAESPGGGA